jgi:hypothetical protein
MKLATWLSEEGLNYVEFGSRIERSGEAVRRYASGERIPDRVTMPRIVHATGGKVTANDFFDLDHAVADSGTTAALSPDTQSEHIGQQASGVAA